jgi:hypothetical protein
MAEILVEYTDVIMTTPDGRRLLARACGAEAGHGRWHGWIEFVDPDSGEVLRSGRETTQPGREQTLYWAAGITPVYLEGALERARHPRGTAPPAYTSATIPPYDGPAQAPQSPPPTVDAVLNPFSVYRNGEPILRRQLAALSGWHLVNIIRAYDLSGLSSTALSGMPARDLIDLIVAEVKRRTSDTGLL